MKVLFYCASIYHVLSYFVNFADDQNPQLIRLDYLLSKLTAHILCLDDKLSTFCACGY